MTIPGIGPITATAVAAISSPAETFAMGRDFAAWLGSSERERNSKVQASIAAGVRLTHSAPARDSGCQQERAQEAWALVSQGPVSRSIARAAIRPSGLPSKVLTQ